jgi:hypothetical protein
VGFHVAVTVLVSSTTSTRALGPLVEIVNNAIDGALVDGTFTGLGTRAAGLAAEGNFADDLAPACLGTGTTGLGALVEASPLAEGAVDGACSRVTAFDQLEHRAFLTTVRGSDFDGTVLFFLATATGLGARGPFVPLGNLTVDGAGLGVASTYFLKIRASLATVGRRLGDLAKTLLVTSTTGARALGKFTPFGYNAIDRIILDNGAEVRVYPLRFVALGTTVVVYDKVEGGSFLHGKGRAGDLLARALVLRPFLDTINESLEHNTIATVAIGVVEASAESESIVLLAERVEKVRVGVGEDAIVVAYAANLETGLVPVFVDHVGTPADRLVVRGKRTELFALNHWIFPEFGVDPFRFVTKFGLLVISLERQGTCVLGVNREADGLLAGDDGLRPGLFPVNDDREMDTISTVAFCVIQTDTGAEHNKFLLQVV